MHDPRDLSLDELGLDVELDSTALSLNVGILHDAKRASTTTAGNRCDTAGDLWPSTSKIQIGDVIFLVSPVRALALSNGVIQLYCESHAASSASVVIGPGLDPLAGRGGVATGRDIFARCSFGVANSRHTVDVDLTIGAAVRLPTATIEVMLFDETPRPTIDGAPAPPYHRLAAAAHASYQPAGAPAVRTQRCWFPIWGDEVPGDPLDLDALFALLA